MSKSFPHAFGQNNLLSTLPNSDRALLDPYLTAVKLNEGAVLEEANIPIKTVYFLHCGLGSIVARDNRGNRSGEVGLFGHEGMSGISVVTYGWQSPEDTFMQIGGEGLAIEADRLRILMDQSPTLQRHLLLYVQVLMTQMAQTALSNGQAKLEERLARWLLMCHDRVSGDSIDLTHRFLAIMLGVRRAGVTVAIHVLEGKGLIRANRGQIIILDRDGLEEAAQDTYGAPEAEYTRLIGPEIKN